MARNALDYNSQEVIDLTVSDDDTCGVSAPISKVPHKLETLTRNLICDTVSARNDFRDTRLAGQDVNGLSTDRAHLLRRACMSLGHRDEFVKVGGSAKRRKTHGQSLHGRNTESSAMNLSTISADLENDQRTNRILEQESCQDGALYHKKLALLLHSQVFTHIKSAVHRYHLQLSAGERNDMGEMTASVLVKDPGFKEHFTANDFRLSECYEKDLERRANALVDRYAAEILMNRVPKALLLPQDSSSSDDSYSRRSSRRLRKRSLRGNSSTSDNPGEFSTKYHLAPEQSVSDKSRIRGYSSSPTTSFSPDTDTRSTLISMGPEKWHSSNAPNRYSVVSATNLRRHSTVEIKNTQLSTSVRNAASSGSLVAEPPWTSRRRPYLRLAERNYSGSSHDLKNSHVNFSAEEMDYIWLIIKSVLKGKTQSHFNTAANITSWISGQRAAIAKLVGVLRKKLRLPGPGLGRQLLRNRDWRAIEAFLEDALEGNIITDQVSLWRRLRPRNRTCISSYLKDREIAGLCSMDYRCGQGSVKEKAASCLEDNLTRTSEWTDCCGDIATVTWTGDSTFVCGAVAHSDYHNMQYNKSGNLGVGSLSSDTLCAVSDHRVVRPLIGAAENAENALDAMRQTQDPWLYTSVVSTSHNESNGFTFTASFDKTVKVWRVSNDGSIMVLHGTWPHENNVNYVVTSDHHNRVATAADAYNDAIRVYHFDEADVSSSPYDTYNGEKAREQAQELRNRDTWAYHPATIQWGKAASVSNLLLVGYSPRSATGHDADIPEDKKNSGELCIWDVTNMSEVRISSAKSQNAFEVMWHPTQPFFVAATSPTGHFEPCIRTQIRLFAWSSLGTFGFIKTLDCPALDINLLTIMPNSEQDSWVTASCTDGNTYVWDTGSQTERPAHVLNHGESLDNPLPELPREVGDEGVKFASWGQSSHRFYTGSSDGRLKAWNIHARPGHALVRHVLEVSGGITAGAFSKDFSKLLIGDATGKVHLLRYDDSDPEETAETELLSKPSPSPKSRLTNPPENMCKKRPKIIVPHPDPPPPPDAQQEAELMSLDKNGCEIFIDLVNTGRISRHPDPAIGAVQGPNYAETHLYRLEAHVNGDASKPLLPEFAAGQQHGYHTIEPLLLPHLPQVSCSDAASHSVNMCLDWVSEREGLDFNWDYQFEMDILPRHAIFGEEGYLRK